MIQPIEIPQPVGGISDKWSAITQEPFTCPSAMNMRSLDPIDGRTRLAQRSGLSKFVGQAIGGDFIQDLIAINKDVRLATYTARTSGPLVEWSKTTPDDSRVPWIAITLGGDIWGISGDTVLAKYNSAGTKILEVQLPLSFSNEKATCVTVGDDAAVFVSTMTDGDHYAGKVFRYEANPLDPEEMILIWTLNAQARVPTIAFNGGYLYLIANKLDESELRKFGELAADSPASVWSRPIPNPSNIVTVNTSGEILVASEPNEARDDVVIGDFCDVASVVDWTPIEIASDIRAWFDASDLAGYSNNEVVDFWADKIGLGRNLSAANQGEGPLAEARATYGGRYISNAICGFPGIRMDGEENSEGVYPGFTSRDGTGALIPPGNTPSFFTMIFKVRNPGADPNNLSDYGKIIERGGQPYFTVWQSATGRFLHGEFTDPTPSDDDGSVSGEEDRVGGISIMNDGDVGILTVAFDPQGDVEGSFFRLNGKVVGAYTADGQFTVGDFRQSDRTRIGYSVWGDQFPNFDLCEAIFVEAKYNNPANYEPVSGGSAGSWNVAVPGGDTSIERIEGYLAHKYRATGALDASHPYKGTAPTASSGGSASSGTSAPASTTDILTSPLGIISKYTAAQGSLRWAKAGPGIGYALVTDDDDNVYSVGPPMIVSGGSSASVPLYSTTVRKLIDQGSSVSIDESSGVGAWSFSGTDPSTSNTRIQIAVDSETNLYVPVYDGTGTPTLNKFNADGGIEWSYLTPSLFTYGFCCAIDTIETDFGDDAIGEPEFLYLGTGLTTVGHGKETLYKLRLVDVTAAVGAPREIEYLAVSEGNIKRLQPGEAMEVVTVTNGAGALNAGSRIVSSIFAYGNVYYIDGEQEKKYDPESGEVSDWISTGAGTLPRRPRIIELWRGRTLLARCEGEPYNMYASEVGNPEGWDLFPPDLLATSAFSLAATSAGQVPDVINALIPYNDELLIIGGDHTIHLLRGDPLGASLNPARADQQSGQIELVSDSTGMAFGRPWCKDDSGVLYFFGSRGGVFRMVPGGLPQNISDERIDKRLEQLDLNYFTVRMVWNEKDRGIHLFIRPIDVVPAASGGSSAPSGGSAIASGGSAISSGGSAVASGGSSIASGGSAAPSGGGASGGGGGGGGLDIGDPDPIDSVESPAEQAAIGEPIMHWFWCRDTQSWWADRFATAEMDPTAVVVSDGDEPSDRVMLIGGADGFVRFWDETVKNDDGEAISASVTIGPIEPKDLQRRGRFSCFRVDLAKNQDGAMLKLFATDEADDIGEAHPTTFTLDAGSNSAWRVRKRGDAVFMQVFNNTIDERFAIESMAATFTPSSRAR